MANKSSSQPLTLSPQSAQFLLEGVNFFLKHPKEKEWHHLDRSSFLFLVQTLTQTPYQKEEESLSQYLEKVAEFLKSVINKEITAPSLPANLRELVQALNEFKKTRDAKALVPQKPSFTIERWINTLKKAKEAAQAKEEAVPPVPPLLDSLNAAIKEELEPYLPDPQKREEAALSITQAVAAHTPEKEINLPQEAEAVAQDIIIASSPEIAQIFTENHVVLDPQQTKNFFDELTEKIALHLPPLAALPHEKRPPTGTPETPASPFVLPFTKGEQISQALKKNPPLLYQSSLPGETSLGEQIEAVIFTRGINPQTAQTITTLAQEARAFYLASQGITASSIEKAAQEAEKKQEPSFPLLEALAKEQKAFEEAHPKIKQLFQKITPIRRLPIAPYSPLSRPPQAAQKPKFPFFYKIIPSSLSETSPLRKILTFPSLLTQKITSFISPFLEKTKIYSLIEKRASHSLARLLSSLKITAKKSVSQAAKKGITKILSFLSTKLAGTKIGAWLGSIAPGVGNAIGAAIGFLFDIGIGFIKGGIRFTNSFLEKITGGETEAQRKLKERLGPFSFLASPLVASFIAAFFLIFSLVFINHTREKTLFVGSGGEFAPSPPQAKFLKINKTASPSVAVTSGSQVTYTIEINAPEGNLENVVITDIIDDKHLSLDPSSINPAPSQQNGNQVIWKGFDFSQPGATLTITYRVTVKEGVSEETKIRNTATVTASHNGENLKISDGVTLNSSCQDIVNTAKEIIASLEKNEGACYWSSSSSLYSHTTDNYWCSKSPHPKECCIYCNNLVTMAYRENGRGDPLAGHDFFSLKKQWENDNILIENKDIDLNQVSEGDIVLFDVGGEKLAHIGIVCEVENDGIYTCEANTVINEPIFYPLIEGGKLGTQYNVTVNSIGKTCEN